MMFRKNVIFFIIVLTIFNYGFTRCKTLIPKVRRASFFYFGLDYPYQYSVSQLFVESSCRWIVSKDIHGSIGYAQITPRFWNKILNKKYKFWKKKDSIDYFYAQSYILYNNYLKTKKYCPNLLFPVYQAYNRSIRKVLKEIKIDCLFKTGFFQCFKDDLKKICVWYDFKKKICKQYRYNCDINYTYVFKVYKYAKKISPQNKSSKYLFFSKKDLYFFGLLNNKKQ